jgi:hypothetical protein
VKCVAKDLDEARKLVYNSLYNRPYLVGVRRPLYDILDRTVLLIDDSLSAAIKRQIEK